MNAFRIGLSLVALASAMACAPEEPSLAPASPDDVAAVAKIVASFDSCARTGALDVFMGHSTEDNVVLFSDQPAIVGTAAIREFYKNFYGTFDIDMRHEPLETFAVGDLVISRGNASGSITPKAGGAPMQFSNKYLMLFRRQADGSLKLWRVAANSNIPPAPPPAEPQK